MADIQFSCPQCQQPIEAPGEWAGQVCECPACGQSITIPTPATDVEPPADACPECKTPMEPGSVLCVQCGFHTKLGKKISTDLT
jgi:hypothetical protein